MIPRFSLVNPIILKVASTPMSKSPAKHKVKRAGKEQPRSRKTRMQYAALPFLCGEDGEVRVVLVTSRETKRWVIPKGWPMRKLSPNDAAAREAYEEAGLVGEVGQAAIGAYTYEKRLRRGSITCRVTVFPLRVEQRLEAFPEQDQRQVRTFSPEEAAQAVAEPELGDLIRMLNDDGLAICGPGLFSAPPSLEPWPARVN
jgi:8-oxo-dGTP pyrophosphatase MutT (NUDIX family)